jgi:glycosyltransferase involved in cell wall biosynthesis
MKIIYLAAGAGGFYCGACARDVALARGLIRRGHDCLMLPLYTPLETDGPDPSAGRVFYGGISAYLEQKFAIFRRRRPLVDRLLDQPWLLRAVARRAIDTRPEDLGAMTVSVLRGAEGRQGKELERLLEFLDGQGRPDVVNLSNALLSAVAGPIKERFGVPVVSTLQGEEDFVNRLPEPYRGEAWQLLRRHAEKIDLFIAPSESYADEAAALLGVPRSRLRAVRPGVDTTVYHPAADRSAAAQSRRIGCVSRCAPNKGTDLLCEAFAALEARRPGCTRLALAGQVGAADRAWFEALRDGLTRRGLAGRVEFHGELELAEKVAFLQNLSVFAQPSRFAERRGMAALEALACGVPIVVPRSGIFPEMVELTGGGVLVEPGNAAALAEALGRVLDDPTERERMSAAARAGVEKYFSAEGMTEATLAVYREIISE